MIIFRSFVLSLVLGLGLSLAQSLSSLAPADSVLALSWSHEGNILESLDDDLASLDWEKSKFVLEPLLAILSEDPDFADMIEAAEDLDDMKAEVLEFCPAFEEDLEALAMAKLAPFDALLSLSMNSFSPIPSVTGLLRLDEMYAPSFVQARDTLLSCIEEDGTDITTLEQDGVPLYVLDDGGDLPIVVGNLDNLFFFSSNPDALRAVIRKATGGNEASLADTALYKKAGLKLENAKNSLGFSLDFEALSSALEGVADLGLGGENLDALFDRLSAMLTTLGGLKAQISVTDEGLLSEMVLAVNPLGGDDALVDILLCETCTVSSPFLAPEGSIALSADYLPWRELWTYLQGWLNEAEAITGEPLNLKQLLLDEFDLDIDVALFNWLGSELHTYVLEPYTPDIGNVLFGPAQVTVVPVSSPEAAQAGLDELLTVFGPLLEELSFLFNPMEIADIFSMSDFANSFAIRNYLYEDVDITRVQSSINLDISYGLVGNYLVIASPSKAIEDVIDTFKGKRSFLSSQDYRTLRASMPPAITGYDYADHQANLEGLAGLIDVLSQPLAFLAQTFLQSDMLQSDLDSMMPETDVLYDADITEVVPSYLDSFDAFTGELTEDDLDTYELISDYLVLPSVEPGSVISIKLSSEAFDTYLSVIDATEEAYIAENDDDLDSSNSELSFVVQEGKEYWLEITSFEGFEIGSYDVSFDLSTPSNESMDMGAEDKEMMADILADVSLADLLDGFDLFTQSLEIIADHTGISEGYDEVDTSNETLYSRSLLHIRW